MSLVKQIQNTLIDDVDNKLIYYIEIKWQNNVGSTHVLTRKNILSQKIFDVTSNYTNYYKKEYKVEKIVIHQVINKNPHIKITSL
jgi:hypothetical protein